MSFVLEHAGWRTIYVNSDLPVSEFSRAADLFRPDALMLSFTLSRNINKRFEELSRITKVPIFVGGRSILNYQGLAKQHGLIPLLGSISTSLDQIADEIKRWKSSHPENAPKD